MDLTGTSSGEGNPVSTICAVNEPAMAVDESVTSQVGTTLNPDDAMLQVFPLTGLENNQL